MTEMRSRHLSVVIGAAVDDVYTYAADPDNLPTWATGLAAGVSRRGELLMIDSPMGEVTVQFAKPNAFGILDHDVALPDGTVVGNPMRVIAHPDGTEAIFTVRQRDLPDDQFDADCAAVQRDLEALRHAVVGPGATGE